MNELFVIVPVSTMAGGLLNPWTGLILLFFWIFSIYRILKETDIEFVEISNLILGFLFSIGFMVCFEEMPKGTTRFESFFIGLFLFLFPFWFIIHAVRDIWW